MFGCLSASSSGSSSVIPVTCQLKCSPLVHTLKGVKKWCYQVINIQSRLRKMSL